MHLTDKKTTTLVPQDDDPTAESRKRDHIELAFQSQIGKDILDERFYYEPLLAPHPKRGSWPAFTFLGKEMRSPLWVSSMTAVPKWRIPLTTTWPGPARILAWEWARLLSYATLQQ